MLLADASFAEGLRFSADSDPVFRSCVIDSAGQTALRRLGGPVPSIDDSASSGSNVVGCVVELLGLDPVHHDATRTVVERLAHGSRAANELVWLNRCAQPSAREEIEAGLVPLELSRLAYRHALQDGASSTDPLHCDVVELSLASISLGIPDELSRLVNMCLVDIQSARVLVSPDISDRVDDVATGLADFLTSVLESDNHNQSG